MPVNSFTNSTVLGTWGLGGSVETLNGPVGYGQVTANTASQLLSSAWGLGIRWVDLASGYGSGLAATRIGSWQSETGNNFKIALKVGRPVKDGRSCPDYRIDSLLREIHTMTSIVGAPAAIIIKDPPQNVIIDYSKISNELRQAFDGILVGFSSHISKISSLACRVQIDSVAEVEFNGINWRSSSGVIRSLSSRGWTVWGMQPLAYGFLTGKYKETYIFPTDDWRSGILPSERKLFWRLAGMFHERLPLLHCPPSVRALAFCYAQPCMGRVVIGPKSASQLNAVEAAWNLAAQPEVRGIVSDFISAWKS